MEIALPIPMAAQPAYHELQAKLRATGFALEDLAPKIVDPQLSDAATFIATVYVTGNYPPAKSFADSQRATIAAQQRCAALGKPLKGAP